MSEQLDAQLNCIPKRFHCYRQFCEARDIIEIGDRSQCDYKMIIVQLLRMIAVTARNQDLLILQVDLVHASHQNFNFTKQLPEGIYDIRDLKIARRDFVEHRREQKEVVATDERDFYRAVSRQ